MFTTIDSNFVRWQLKIPNMELDSTFPQSSDKTN